MPKALGGAGGEATNPEQLFAAGYAQLVSIVHYNLSFVQNV